MEGKEQGTKKGRGGKLTGSLRRMSGSFKRTSLKGSASGSQKVSLQLSEGWSRRQMAGEMFCSLLRFISEPTPHKGDQFSPSHCIVVTYEGSNHVNCIDCANDYFSSCGSYFSLPPPKLSPPHPQSLSRTHCVLGS